MASRIKLGIVCDEVFNPDIVGGYGGFGWLTRAIVELFLHNPTLGVEIVPIVAGAPERTTPTTVHGTRGVFPYHGGHALKRVQSVWSLVREQVDLLLTVDYRPSYNFALKALPRTPSVMWIQDPRTPEDIIKCRSLQIPGQDGEEPYGADASGWGMSSFGVLHRWRARFRVRDLFAISAPSLSTKTGAAFGVEQPERILMLPYPVKPPSSLIVKSKEPTVLFLGRLDPVKRPWIYVEIARRFPKVVFLVAGTAHATGPGAWTPEHVPDNVVFLGHIDGAQKERVISESWVLINTSIHEAMPVSYIEALQAETPVIGCQDPDQIASRFGRFVGRWDGSGLDSVESFGTALQSLLDDRSSRGQLGRAGREWALATHTEQRFLTAFSRVAQAAGFDTQETLTSGAR